MFISGPRAGKRQLLAETLIWFVPLPLLALSGYGDVNARWLPVLLMLILSVYSLSHNRIWERIHFHHLKEGWGAYTFVTLVSLFVILSHDAIFQLEGKPWLGGIPGFWVGSLILSWIQEVIFRAQLWHRWRQVGGSQESFIILSGLLFAAIHTFIPMSIPHLIPWSFVYGTAMAYVWVRHPNIAAATLSHWILNMTALFTGFVQVSAGLGIFTAPH